MVFQLLPARCGFTNEKEDRCLLVLDHDGDHAFEKT